MEQKISLNESQINEILSFIQPLPGIPKEIAQEVVISQKEDHARQLRDVMIYPSKIPQLTKILKASYHRSLIQAGKNVGALSSSSIGEKNTQSVGPSEIVKILYKNKIIAISIGVFCDNIINSPDHIVIYDESSECVILNNYSTLSISQQGKIEMKKIQAVIRHHHDDNILNIKTASGKTIQGTKGHSFLLYRDTKIFPILGQDLVLGDVLPVIHDNVLIEDKITNIQYEPYKGWVYDFSVEGNETFLASQIFVHNSSLSSFHSSGQQKVALLTGVPRLEELLNVSKEIRTPSMEVYFTFPDDKRNDLAFIKHYAQKVLEYKELESFISDYNIQENRTLTTEEELWYKFHKTFISEEYENCTWSVRLIFNVSMLFMYRYSLAEISSIIHKAYKDAYCVYSPDNIGIIDVYIATNSIKSVEDTIEAIRNIKKRGNKRKDELEYEDLIMLITDENKEYYFIRDLVMPSLLYIPLGGIEGISKVYFDEQKDGSWMVSTKGSNLKTVLGLSFIDSKKTSSNHLWDIYECFGIEATRFFLHKEMSKLLSVSTRHLDLLIDSMTYSGIPTACSRYGIDRKQVGVLAQVAFERAFENFFSAAMTAEKEDCRGVSAAIFLGKYPSLGSHYSVLIDPETGKELNEEQLTYDYERKMKPDIQPKNVFRDSGVVEC